MATTKVTITIDDEQLEQVQQLVAAGQADTVSGFVRHAIDVALHDAAGWREMLAEALSTTGGPLTRRERQWADGVLGGKRRPRRRAVA